MDGGGRGFVLEADFDERAKRARWLLAGEPVYAFDFTNCLSEDIVFADDDTVLFRLDRENVEGLAGGEAQALALADRKIVDAIVTADHVAVFVDDFSLCVLQRDSALA